MSPTPLASYPLPIPIILTEGFLAQSKEEVSRLFQHFRATFPKSKYILITGEMSYEMAESTRTLGLDALMLKPFDFMILEDNISGLLSAVA